MIGLCSIFRAFWVYGCYNCQYGVRQTMLVIRWLVVDFPKTRGWVSWSGFMWYYLGSGLSFPASCQDISPTSTFPKLPWTFLIRINQLQQQHPAIINHPLLPERLNWTTHSRSSRSSNATMAPTKKAKKSADGINSRLALVMKSGKGTHLKMPSPLPSRL